METLIYYPADKPSPTYLLPDTTTSIESTAFSDSQFLSSIEASLENQFFQSLDGVLFNKSLKILVSYPKGRADKTYTVPQSATSIADWAFRNCFNLSRVQLPNSITSIGAQAFSNCMQLTHITLPDSMTSIGEQCFSNCWFIKTIDIPRGITAIGYQVFADCSSLTRITIPDTVVSIGRDAFENCYGLTRIDFDGEPPTLKSDSFDRFHSASIYVWPKNASSFGGEGEEWNGFPVAIRDTSPQISSVSFQGTTSTITLSGGPDRIYLCKGSLDLRNFDIIETSPDIIMTDSSGRTTFTVTTSETKNFYIIEESL